MVPEIQEKLQSLQDILSEKYQLESELKELPKSLQTKQEILSRLKKTYLERNQQYEECRIRIVDFRGQIEQATKDRESSEAMIVDISTQREYEALLKQIKDANDREQQFRRDLQREEKNYEDLSQQLEREESMIAQQEQEYKEENDKIQQESLSRKKQIEALEKRELDLTNDNILDAEILFKFRRIIRKKEGRGIVPLRKGVCPGCNMILPMEFVNTVRQAEHIYFCPYCSMILFHEDTDDNYFNFDITAFVGTGDDDDSMGDDEELDEGALMEEAMNEGHFDDESDEGLGEEDEVVEDEEIEDEAEEETAELGDEEITEVGLDDVVEDEMEDEDDPIDDE